MAHDAFLLNDVLDDFANRLAPAGPGDGPIQDVVCVSDAVPRGLTGDAAGLGRILDVLAKCAADVIGPGDIVANVDLPDGGTDGAQQSTRLRFVLKKGGFGLTFEEAIEILTRFRAGDGSQSRGASQENGSAMDLVDRLGGSIGIASEPERGFRIAFTAEFGVQPGAAGDPKGRGGRALRHNPNAGIKMPDGLDQIRGARILLAEDHPVNQNLTREILVQAGCDVDIAEDGQSTVDAVRNGGDAYDAVLMDVQMPIMDGFEATRRIRELRGEEDLPIIAMTANVLGDERERCLAAGMNDYVPKPIHIPNLYAALIRWVKSPEPERRPAAEAAAPAAVPAVAPPDEPELSLPAQIPEIDVEAGLARAMGNRDLYAGLLVQFAKTNESLGADVAAAAAKGDLELARFLVHGLASTAGNIGADDLYAAANALEKAIVEEQDEDISALLAAFRDRLDTALEAIRQSGVGTPDRPARLGNGSAPFDPAEAAQMAERLAALLEDQDMAAQGQLDDMLEMFGGRGQDEQLERLRATLQALEFKEAQEILADICKEILA